jgi:hypothetical protein
MSVLTAVTESAQKIWNGMPPAPAWQKVLDDAKAEYILHGALVYVLMQPVLSYIFAKRERYTGERKRRKESHFYSQKLAFLFYFVEHKFAWKTLMTSYNIAMCLYSLVTAVVSINGLIAGGGILTGRMSPLFRFVPCF